MAWAYAKKFNKSSEDDTIDMKKQDYILAISQFQNDMANFSGDEEVLFDYMSILDPNDDSLPLHLQRRFFSALHGR